jgi:Zn-dependent alcohol dehydrogenase
MTQDILPLERRIGIWALPLHFGRTLACLERGQSRQHAKIPKTIDHGALDDFGAADFINRRGSVPEIEDVTAGMRSSSVIRCVLVP